jgi:phosphoribosylanthranilate isomerase
MFTKICFTKICANTNLADALLAAELGATAVGFVFAESKRHVSAEQVAAITRGLPQDLLKVGVFATPDAETDMHKAAQEIVATVRAAGLNGVQLHSAYRPELVRTLRAELGAAVMLVQSVHWQVGEGQAEEFRAGLQALREDAASFAAIDAVLVDSRTATASGGTGVAFDWAAAREALSELGDKKLIVAGGLDADNVAEAIRQLRPWGVDVASGVEASAGKKSPERMRAFLAASRAG